MVESSLNQNIQTPDLLFKMMNVHLTHIYYLPLYHRFKMMNVHLTHTYYLQPQKQQTRDESVSIRLLYTLHPDACLDFVHPQTS
ncbi:hypothetical protein Hanom_Chr17g01535391 [Helianthus anomalus]